MNETLGASLEAILAAVATRTVSAADLAETHLAALERISGPLNAVARLEPEAARAGAQALDRRLAAGEPVGPLAGAPLAHKDLYDRAGRLSEAGSRILAGRVAETTAHAVTRLDAADALDLGRLNTVEFALGTEGRNIHTGPPRNPWNTAHSTGGSSSGSGAAVASGAIPAAMGSDTGGSIRLPAAACGLVGLKPTAGRVGRSGIFPLSGSLDTAGPLCRTVRDTALMLCALAGPDPADPQSVDAPFGDPLAGIEDGYEGLRFGVARSYFFDPVTTTVGARLEAAIAAMASEGAAIRDVALPGIEVANRLTLTMIAVEASAQHREWLATRAADYGAETLTRLVGGAFVPAQAYLAAVMHRRTLLAAALAGPFAEVDIVATPAWPMEVPQIVPYNTPGFAGKVSDSGHCSRPFNFLGLPALVLPVGLDGNGVPVAIQLVARPFAERKLLRAARALERTLRFHESHRPTVTA
ncbi:amidase [Acuticoccus sp. I52.16.1]|uniref:amidase n=1 Tax=Acuticoccus sp. I52.16.1 TaxID=2928472 RepID=UPI001FD04422|nr:amidase [Acuticoccus sp. I52.16.1]UOM36491.1 amidase [Acuticoccus sp. I52.16.1]